jgi:hypothetical protein
LLAVASNDGFCHCGGADKTPSVIRELGAAEQAVGKPTAAKFTGETSGQRKIRDRQLDRVRQATQ